MTKDNFKAKLAALLEESAKEINIPIEELIAKVIKNAKK